MEPERRPARWDGRPFPGKCGYGDCPNQATSSFGYWDGGGPGLGTWRQRGRCDEHLGQDDPSDPPHYYEKEQR